MKPRLVIVEDDPDIALLQAKILEQDYACTLVTDHFERATHPSLWRDTRVGIFDLMLPGVSGESLLRLIAWQHPNVRRVVCTAMPIHELPQLGRLADYVLLKPFSPAQLREAVG